MNPTIDRPEIQTRIRNIASELSDDPMLGHILQMQDVESSFLYNGLSHLLQSALHKDRELYSQDHQQDRANGFSPRRLSIWARPRSISKCHGLEKDSIPGFYRNSSVI